MNVFQKYKDEVQEKWSNTNAYKEHCIKTRDYSKEKWQSLSDEMNKIIDSFSKCMINEAKCDSLEAQTLVRKLQNHISDNYYHCTNEILLSLGQMYVNDERFRKNIDKSVKGTAEFINSAIIVYYENKVYKSSI